MVNNSSNTSSTGKAFDLLHPDIQQQLYAMNWTELRPIQVDSIREIIRTDKHIVISAHTAGGKTEAAFLPILSKILEGKLPGVAAVYIGPLKALINDQFRRLEDLCKRASIPVHRWHGDVSQSAKQSLINDPSGVLLITPESLESLFINRSQYLDRLFNCLTFIVVDEMHAFMGTERGAHLKSLICRLVPHSNQHLRLVGLSATLGNMKTACKWLCPDAGDETKLVVDETEEKTIRYMIHGYLRTKSQTAQTDRADGLGDESISDPVVTDADVKLAEDLYSSFFDTTALIFSNNKAKLEFYADLVRRHAEGKRLPHPFRVHHGSLGRSEREDAEKNLRSSGPTPVFCSSTLEMGIDVGDVSIIGQIGPPWSVNSLIQRLGRSGRLEDSPSVMRVFIDEYEPDANASVLKRLHLGLLQSVAMSELMLEKWCEPPELDRLHASTLTHQIMSVIAQRGGINARQLYDSLVDKGAFINISMNMYKEALRSLAANDVIEQTPEMDLILGLKGESIVRRYDFYAAFRVDEELRVIHKDKCIGSILFYPGIGAQGFLILAGRRWKIMEIDVKRKEIIVTPSKGGRLPFFARSGGPDIHPRVREKMREVLLSETEPKYLDSKANELLKYAREVASKTDLKSRALYEEGANHIWFTWTGSKINRTLMGLSRFYSDLNASDEGIALVFEGESKEKIRCALEGLSEQNPSAEDLAARFSALEVEKFDEYLSHDVLARVFACNSLDVPGAVRLIKDILRSWSGNASGKGSARRAESSKGTISKESTSFESDSNNVRPGNIALTESNGRRESTLDFVAVDFETANSARSSACAIGIAVVDNGQIIETKHLLIKPTPFYFDPFNISIHGITEEDVRDEPEFSQLWPTISKYFQGRTLIAHNASFDISVLRHILDEYGIPYPEFEFSCTRIISKKVWPSLFSYALDVVSSHRGIEFKHHCAEQDALACARIAIQACQEVGASSLIEVAEKLNFPNGRLHKNGYQPVRLNLASHYAIRPGEIVPSKESFDQDHPFYDKTVAFTGALRSMSRKDAMQKVVDAGGRCTNAVNRTVSFLVTGEQDYRRFKDGKRSNKMKRVEALISEGFDIEIIDEDEFLKIL